MNQGNLKGLGATLTVTHGPAYATPCEPEEVPTPLHPTAMWWRLGELLPGAYQEMLVQCQRHPQADPPQSWEEFVRSVTICGPNAAAAARDLIAHYAEMKRSREEFDAFKAEWEAESARMDAEMAEHKQEFDRWMREIDG